MKEECNFEVEKSVSLRMEVASCLQHAGHCWTSVISQMYTLVSERIVHKFYRACICIYTVCILYTYTGYYFINTFFFSDVVVNNVILFFT